MNKMYAVMSVFSLVVYGIGLSLTQDKLAWSLGIVVGLIIAILKLRLMENTLKNAIKMQEEKAKSYTQRHYMLRYLVTGVVLVVAALNPNISLIGVFIGLLSMKVGAYVSLLVDRTGKS